MRRLLVVVGLFLFVSTAGGAEPARLFVSPRGNDHWSGKLAEPNAAGSDGPLATLQRARDEIRKVKAAGGLPPGGIVVEVLAGRYELAAPVELTAEDSGTAESPIVYRARPGDVVHVSGGRIVAGWKPVTDPAILSRLDPAARGKVFETDLKAQGITEYGDLGLDAAWELQVWLARVDHQGEDAMGSAYASVGKKVRPRLEVFFNDTPMEISRWPNEGFIKIEEVLGETERDVRGVKGCNEGIFVYEGDRPRRWVGEKDPWVQGYWFRDWAVQRHKIQSIDLEKRVISVVPPYHDYGYRKGQWFRGFNLLAEIDVPGEWYIDRETGVLYFWPPQPLDRGRVEVSMASGLFTLNDTSHVTIQGLLMEAARSTAVAIRGGRQCRVVGCTFRNLGNHAVTVFEGEQHGVVGCDMYGMGGGGIYLVGGDRKALTPAGHFAENNHVHHFGRWDRTYRPGLFLSGVGLRASHNLIHDAPHAAILFGGNDHLFEYNEIHNVCNESHDCGAIYAGRSWTLRGHVIQYNYLHHLWGKDGGPCNGIYLDDLFSSAAVRGNVFYQVFRPVFLGGGRDNVIQNNVFVDCPKALHVDARALGWCGPHADGRIKEAQEKGTIAGVRYREPPFSTRYPQLVNLLDEDPKSPRGNVVRRNVFWPGRGENIRRVQGGEAPTDTWWDDVAANIKPLVKLEDNLIDEDPKFVDEEAGDFQLRADSPAWKLGFQRIAVEKIGLYQDDRRATWPVTHEVRPMPETAAH
ncbi:MAG TPA: right-handed parallel beta-helix repeat-containing protein [Thermoguttaceae bacterium]|nr:right-handed parallel beta-helix repeat-containing protein [Thermoguttaceae bacterium]